MIKVRLNLHLDCLCGLQRLFRRNPDLSLPQELLDKVGDVAACYRDVLYTAPNHVALCLRAGKGKTTKQAQACMTEPQLTSVAQINTDSIDY